MAVSRVMWRAEPRHSRLARPGSASHSPCRPVAAQTRLPGRKGGGRESGERKRRGQEGRQPRRGNFELDGRRSRSGSRSRSSSAKLGHHLTPLVCSHNTMAKGSSSSSGKARQHAPQTTDARFARLHTDPRFLRPQRDDSKVVVDDRFKAMLDGGADFGVHKRNTKVDRFGRKKGKGAKAQQELEKIYKLQREEDDESNTGESDGSGGDEDDEDKDDEAETGDKHFVDYARGAADLESSGSEDEDEDDDNTDASSSDSDESDDGLVEIGPSAVLRRERRRRAARGSESSSDDSQSEDDDIHVGEEVEREIDDKALAALDAQAARVVAAGKEEDDDEEADGEPQAGPSRAAAASSSSFQRSKSKRKQATIPYGQETRRLAVVNMDWDHVRALDLYKVFSSLVSPLATRVPMAQDEEVQTSDRRGGRSVSSLPVKGSVQTVRVYPSDFGRERMKREDIEGPPKDIFKGEADATGSSKKSKKNKKKKRRDEDDSDEENALFQEDEGGEFDEEALRKYQLERLRYYYAIATFDSPRSARHVYDAVDGAEMERTANIFDLQFVPNDMVFPEKQGGEDGWRDEAKPGYDDGVSYKGADWATDALRHSKVKLTWDAPDPERMKVTKRKGLTKDQIRDEDFKAYLATDSEGSDEDDDLGPANGKPSKPNDKTTRDRFRALMGLDGSTAGNGKKTRSAFEDARPSDDEEASGGEDGDMEITFMPGLSEAAARKAAGAKAPGQGEDETTLEKYLRKQREKKERRKAAKAALEDGGDKAEEADAAVVSNGRTQAGDLGFEDPFFASDGEDEDVDLDAMLAKEQANEAKTGSKAPSSRKTESTSAEPTPDDVGDESDGGRNHFSLQDVLKAERGGKKLNRWEKKKLAKQAKRQQQQQRQESQSQSPQKELQTQQGFEMNVADPRFSSALMKDHEFALDPTHPSFTPTEGMKKLLDERRRASAKASEEEAVLAREREDKRQKNSGSGGGGGGGGKQKRKAETTEGNVSATQAGTDDPAALLKSLKQRHQQKQQSGQNGRQMDHKKRKTATA